METKAELTKETYQYMKRLVNGFLNNLVRDNLLIKANDDIEPFDTEKGSSETVYSLASLLANDLAETHGAEGSVDEFENTILDYLYFNGYSEYF